MAFNNSTLTVINLVQLFLPNGRLTFCFTLFELAEDIPLVGSGILFSCELILNPLFLVGWSIYILLTEGFKECGGRLKCLAKFMGGFVNLVVLIVSSFLAIGYKAWWCLALGVVICIFMYLFSLFIYGFGIIVDKQENKE